MTRAEAVRTIREMATGALEDELRYYVLDVDRETENGERPYDLLDALEDAETANNGYDRVLTRQIELVQRAIGMRAQVQPGVEVVDVRGGMFRTLKPGAWVAAKAYSEFA